MAQKTCDVTYWTSLSSGVRPAFERRKKGLNQKCRDGVRLRRFTQKEEMGELHQSLTAVWQKNWHAKFGMYEPPPIACLEGLAAQGWMRSYVLMADGSPVAYQLGYQYRETFYCDSIGFDADWRDYSPGKLLSHLLIEDLFVERTPRTLDFGFGYNDYKRDLGNHAEERAQASLALTARGRVVLSGVDACDGSARPHGICHGGSAYTSACGTGSTRSTRRAGRSPAVPRVANRQPLYPLMMARALTNPFTIEGTQGATADVFLAKGLGR